MDPKRLQELSDVWDLQAQHGFWQDQCMILPPGLKYDDTEILIEGHTDSSGSDELNQTLSDKRATSVKSYLSTPSSQNLSMPGVDPPNGAQ